MFVEGFGGISFIDSYTQLPNCNWHLASLYNPKSKKTTPLKKIPLYSSSLLVRMFSCILGSCKLFIEFLNSCLKELRCFVALCIS